MKDLGSLLFLHLKNTKTRDSRKRQMNGLAKEIRRNLTYKENKHGRVLNIFELVSIKNHIDESSTKRYFMKKTFFFILVFIIVSTFGQNEKPGFSKFVEKAFFC